MVNLDKLPSISEDNKFISQIKQNIKSNTKEYIISKGDSIYSIAKNLGIKESDLYALNFLLGREIPYRGKKSIIKTGDKLYIPKDVSIFLENIKKINDILEVLKTNEKFTKEGINELVENANLFPRGVQSLGIGKALKGLIGAQKFEYDPRLPRVVDSSRETHVSCANLIRTYMYYSINPKDLKQKEKVFFKKQNIDAWMLPSELKKIGFEQKFADLMDSFDQKKLGQTEPLRDKDLYDKKVLELNKYLETSGVPGSLVPLYFKFSHFKDDVARYNEKRKDDKHFNTHQSMFAGNDSITFGAFEVKDYSTGEPVSFGGDKQVIENEIKELNKETEEIKNNLVKIKSYFISYLDIKKNPELLAREKSIDRAILVSTSGNNEQKEKIKQIIFSTDDKDKIKEKIEKILKIKQTKEDIDYFIALKKNYNKVLKSILLILKNSSLNIKIEESLGYRLEANKELLRNISKYNYYVSKINQNNLRIKGLNDKLKVEKKINLVDYIANFIQDRLDYSSSAFSLETRKRVIEGIIKYNSMIHIKVNGQQINLAQEIERYKKGKPIIYIKPSTKIEITGPIMLDGEHQVNKSDEDRKNKMNSRTRFLFEFIASQSYLATELLEPGKESSFRKTDFGHISDKLGVKAEYDLRRGETLEKVLKEKIPLYEKSSFDKLDKNSPDYDKKYKNLVNYFYDLQIKSLQLSGYIQSEDKLNPGSVKINRPIPYFETKNIKELFDYYIKEQKNIRLSSFNSLKDLKKFVSLETYPGDTEEILFSRLSFFLKNLDLSKYKYLKNIDTLSYPMKIELIESVFKDIYDKNHMIKIGKKISLSFSKLDKEIGLLLNKKTRLNTPKLKEIDEFIIENTASSENSKELLKNILYRESYFVSDKKFNPTSIKSYAKLFVDRRWLKRTFEDKITSLGDFHIRLVDLKNGFNEKGWLNKETLNRAISKLDDENIKSQINKFSGFEQGVIKYDLGQVDEIKNILAKKDLNRGDFEILYNKFKYLLRLNPGDNSNYVGKVLSSVLLEAKINDHSEKLAGIMAFSGENIKDIYKDENLKKSYEQRIIIINNLTETTSLLAFSENYLLRIINAGLKLKPDTKDVYNKSFIDGYIKGKLDYNKEVFLSHIKDYRDFIKNKTFNSEEDKKIVEKIDKFYINLYEANINNDNKRFLEVIYDFNKDLQIKKFLAEKGLSTSILPDKTELKASNFQESIFTYLNKFDS